MSGEEREMCRNSGTMNDKMTIVDVSDDPLTDEEFVYIYRWLDSLRFSRPKKKTSTHRDFSDGVMMAELVSQYIPKIINRRYYIPSSSSVVKLENWEHLNNCVFRQIRFQMTHALIKAVTEARPGMIEKVLKPLHVILMQRSKAVKPNKKLQNVKSRFMDYENIRKSEQIGFFFHNPLFPAKRSNTAM